MDWNANHAGFVLAAYAIVAFVLAAVVLRTLWRAKMLKAALREMKLPDTGQRDTE
jgi:heme exporter protein CcmD